MSDFRDLMQHIEDGMEGRNIGVPMGFPRLNNFIGIRKGMYSVVFGATGSGKSAFVHDAFILNPFDWYMSKTNKTDIKFKVILFSMERSKQFIHAKWLSRRIFLDTGLIYPMKKMLKWMNEGPSKEDKEMFETYESYFEALEEVVDFHEGARSPADIYRICKEYADDNGETVAISEYKKIYVPKHSNHIVIPIVDHIGLTKTSKELSQKKQAIDMVSEYFQKFRDFYKMSPVVVCQINRDLGSVLYQKMDSFEPTLDHIKESGRPGEDADQVISLFDPNRYNTQDRHYKDVTRFINNANGAKHFRSLKILKNTYGEDDIAIGMAFWGASGIFKELPRPLEMEGFDYQSLMDGTYFLTHTNNRHGGALRLSS